MNPVNPNYFYLIKNQGLDDDMEIKNYVLAEDYDNFKAKMENVENDIPEVDEDDSEAEDFEDNRDFFELALQRLRENKEYNIGKYYGLNYSRPEQLISTYLAHIFHSDSRSAHFYGVRNWHNSGLYRCWRKDYQ